MTDEGGHRDQSIALRWIYFLAYLGVGIFHPYLYIYLRQAGMSEGAVGIASFLAPVAVMLAQPTWGILGDLTGKPGRIIAFSALGTCIISILIFLPISPLWYYLLVPMFFGMGAAVDPVTNAAAVEVDRQHGAGGQYGSKRMWGSIGFVCGAIVSGLVSEWGIRYVFPVYSVAMVLVIIRTQWLAGSLESGTGSTRLLESVQHALGKPEWRWLLLFFILWGIPFSGNFVAFGWYWQDLGGSDYGVGLCWVLAAVLEVPLYWLTVRHRESIPFRGLLLFSGFIAALRWLLYILFPVPALLYFFQPLHSLMFVCFSVGGVYYIDHLADPVLSNTGQSLLSACVFGAGAAVGNLMAGFIYQWLGPQFFYFTMIVINIVGVLIGIYKLSPVVRPIDGEEQMVV